MSSKRIKYPTTPQTRRYTTVWNINVRKTEPETCIMINDTSATLFRCGGMLDHLFIINSRPSPFWNNFWNSLTVGKVMRKKIIASSAMCAGALSCWKMNSFEIWRTTGRNCCNSITLRLVLLTGLDSVIDKCPTDVTSSCQRLATRWLMPSVTERYLWTQSFYHDVCLLADGCAYSPSFCQFFGVFTLNVFSSANKNFANIMWRIFLSNIFEWLSIAWEFASLSSGAWRCLSTKHFTRWCTDAFEVWWDI